MKHQGNNSKDSYNAFKQKPNFLKDSHWLPHGSLQVQAPHLLQKEHEYQDLK